MNKKVVKLKRSWQAQSWQAQTQIEKKRVERLLWKAQDEIVQLKLEVSGLQSTIIEQDCEIARANELLAQTTQQPECDHLHEFCELLMKMSQFVTRLENERDELRARVEKLQRGNECYHELWVLSHNEPGKAQKFCRKCDEVFDA